MNYETQLQQTRLSQLCAQRLVFFLTSLTEQNGYENIKGFLLTSETKLVFNRDCFSWVLTR